jgi:Fic family protein
MERNMSERAGTWKTNLSGEAAYRSFAPAPLPPGPPLALDGDTVELLVQANRQLAVLEGITARIPSVKLFISMYVRKEALLSSQIEGTQATLEDILDPLIEENVNLNVAEVINYIKATEFAIARLQTLPLCNRLIRETHVVLLEAGRGQTKNPGEFRRSQNWIGGQGSSLKNARYIPPAPEDMTRALADLEKYINTDDDLDPLIRAALIHYQFETIHPFLDGNGRVGRLLIILFLMEKKILSSPTLYISYSLKKNRTEYYDRLTAVRDNGNFEQWVKFFLQAVYESAYDAVAAIDQLSVLHDHNIARIAGFGRGKKTAAKLFAYLEEKPIIDIRKTAAALKLTFKTVSGAVERLSNAGILAESTGKRRNRLFLYDAYIRILKEGTELY